MTTLRLMVCPHDTANDPDRWYTFAQYLSQQLHKQIDISVFFEISLDFQDFHEHMQSADIVYANPADTITLIDQQGGFALVRPDGHYDEVVFIANHAVDAPTLKSLQHVSIASVANLVPTKIALHMLAERSIEPQEVTHYDSWLSVIGAVWRDEVRFGLVYKDTYDELSEQGKQMTQAFLVSQEQKAFHALVLKPSAIPHRQVIESILLGMEHDEHGKEVLQELHMTHWVPIHEHEIADIRHLLQTY
ncbi:MAG: phosphate/phosphite/phosphonate ABC transporter substrate-binding protein [Chloroflexaceae bacterium]|nr:phosphate/phosphite/phosphonate ABC transporter substrate-binding protein [Chloroflexaceae bacterium]